MSKDDPPLRVAFVITGLATGGAEVMLERLLCAFSPGIVPLVISLSTLGEVGPRLQARGIDVVALGMRPGVPSPLAIWRLSRLLRAFRADAVHTWMYHADLVGGVAARLAGIRAVMWGIRQSNIDPALNKRSTLWVMKLCAWASSWLPARIACVANRARAVHVAAGYSAARCVVIPNGFDLGRFRADVHARDSVRIELGLDLDAPLVGMIGRFDPQKNHRGFVEALALLRARVPGVRAVLAGSGVDGSNEVLLRWMDEAGVRDVCHLLGRRDDMPRLMAALDVLLLPSLGEAFPNVVGEAMACGVPCAVTNVGDAAEMVGELGRVVGSGDMPALAAAAAELLTLPAARRGAMADALQADVRRRYEIGAVAERYEREYRTLVAG